MNFKLCLMSLSAALSMGLPAIARADAPQNYWGMGIDGLDLETVATGTELDMNGFNLRYGFWFPFDLIGVEFRLGSVAEQTGTLVGNPEVRYALGLAKANLPFETVSMYAMGGISKSYYDFAGVESDEEDIVAGVGIELLGTETTGLTLEFLKYGMDDDALEGSVITFGFNHRFELPGFR
jgi:hypothetical protein